MNTKKIEEFIWFAADATRSSYNYRLDENYISLMYTLLLLKKIELHDKAKKEDFFAKILSGQQEITDSISMSFKESQDYVPESVYAPLIDRIFALKGEKDILIRLLTLIYRMDFTNEELSFLAKKLLTIRAMEGRNRYGEFISSRGLSDVFEMLSRAVEGGNYYDGFFRISSFVSSRIGKKFFIYGHEIIKTIAEIANAYLFIIDKFTTSRIIVGNGLLPPLTDPSFIQKSMDLVLSNPPFGQRPSQDFIRELERDILGRFPEGICRNDVTLNYVEYIAAVLKDSGKGFVTSAHGPLSREGTEKKVRESLLLKGNIECVISLPTGLINGTAIPSAIVCLSSKETNKEQIKFIAADKLSLKRVRGDRFLSEEDLKKIWDAYNSNVEIKDFSKVVKIEEIKKNNFVLLPSRYIVEDLEINFVDYKILERETEKFKQAADQALLRINELMNGKLSNPTK